MNRDKFIRDGLLPSIYLMILGFNTELQEEITNSKLKMDSPYPIEYTVGVIGV